MSAPQEYLAAWPAQPQPGEPPAPAGRRRRAWQRPGLALAVLIIALVIAWAVIPGAFAPQNPDLAVTADKLAGPSWSHLFGTDEIGRDEFSRVVYGARQSLAGAALAVVVGALAGSLLGLLAGFFGGLIDDIVMRVVDILLAIPGLLLALAMVTALGFGTLQVAFAVGVASVAGFARVMRAEVLRVRTAPYIEAAYSGGQRWPAIVARHVLPNAAGPVIVLVALDLGTAILAVSALSFLGYGAPPPAPEWGSLVSDGQNYLDIAWWMTVFPGLVVALVAIAANTIARALEEARG